ncbi:MAG: carboxymuconolactone decarboxylase family protein [Hyphomicrobiales bacterium]|nr:carboxymuconolactone decarboxylase family protein [Hyphomicrobiales bacterium]
MTDFTVHSEDNAPDASKTLLQGAQKKVGFVPNLFGVMAGSPQLLEAYLTVSDIFSSTDLSPVEQQVVLLAINHANDCHYCMAAHSTIAQMVKMPEDVLVSLREGTPIADTKLEALRVFATAMNEKRGWVSDADIEVFVAAGYSKRDVLNVVLAVSYKVMSNFTNHFARTPVDDAFAKNAWVHPQKRGEAAE